MAVCTFFGHRECRGLDRERLLRAIEEQILDGVDTFYVGNQGQFDAMVHGCLKQLEKTYPGIRYAVVLAYLPEKQREFTDFSDTMYPLGLEVGPPKFAIDRRNRWLVDHADRAVCHIRHTWGGAYKYASLAKRRGLQVLNLGDIAL